MKVIFKPLSREVENSFYLNCDNNERLTIGRKNTNDVVLPFRNVSSFHSIVECSNKLLFVEDLNSTNGTFVNGERIDGRVALKNGDRVKFATYEFLVEFRKEENAVKEKEDIPQDGTVFMVVSNVEEIQQVLEEKKIDEEKGVSVEETGKETVLYGVKGLVQNGRLVLLDEDRNFLKEYELTEFETAIGRENINNISIDHPSISRVHCFINRKDEYYEIVDNDSTNGVFVNGKKVKKALLKNGDIVKLGDKEFVFIAPGELFSPAFLEKGKSKKGFSFNKKNLYIGIFAVFFVILIILFLIPGERKNVTRGPQISEKELKLDVLNSFKNEDWDNVIYLVENFNLKGFEQEYARAKFEIENRKKFLEFVDRLNSNDFSGAKEVLNKIPADSVYKKKGEKLFLDKKNEYITNKLGEIDSLIDERNIVLAYQKVNELKEKFPGDEKVSLIAEKYEKRYKLYLKRKKARERFFAIRRQVRAKANSLLKEAKELYLKGEIVDSIARVIDAEQIYTARNLNVPVRITRLKEALSKVRDLYLKGKKQVMQGDTESAAKNFEKLFKISKKHLWQEDGSIEKECKRLLKDYYIKKADSYYRVNNYTKALDYANRVLDIDPTERSMQALKRDILRTAKSLYNKGYIEQTQYNNCKAALFYYRQVVKILPPDDPVYKKAIKRMKQCEK